MAKFPNSALHIGIEMVRGRADDEDKDRARAAVVALLNARGVIASEAAAEYRAQWERYDDEGVMHGLALDWIDARRAADIALTDGWADPDGASCDIDA